MDLEWNDAAILGAAVPIRKLVDAIVEMSPKDPITGEYTLGKYKIVFSALFSFIVTGTLLLPEPYQMYLKMTFALMFATAFYNDWYKSRKTDISVENIEKVSVSNTPKEV